MSGYWEELERPAPDAVALSGSELRAGSRVRLRPRGGGDVWDLVLAGRIAVVEAVEQDLDGEVKLAVVVEDDPGRDLGFARQPGHRFFFSLSEVEPLEGSGQLPATPARILVAGIGNVFRGDDGFGVALADRLWRRELPDGVEVVDFGIRGMDLAFAMQDGYDAVVLLDAVARGEPAGTLSVIKVDAEGDSSGEVAVDAHGMDPVNVIALVRRLGAVPPPIFVVGCEAKTWAGDDDEQILAALSEPVRAAIGPAIELVESLLSDLGSETNHQEVP
jgi:hydrogenase maturation protease